MEIPLKGAFRMALEWWGHFAATNRWRGFFRLKNPPRLDGVSDIDCGSL